MSDSTPVCPVCTLGNTYPDGKNLVCADCEHEWSAEAASASAPEEDADEGVRDANGALLAHGDSVALMTAFVVSVAPAGIGARGLQPPNGEIMAGNA